MAKESQHNRLKEINAQIRLKLAEGDLKGAERLSTRLIETAEGIEAAAEQSSPFDALVSKVMTTVTAHLPAQNTTQQLELVRRDAIDIEHLRLLSLFHYVNAGLIAAMSCFFLLYVIFGVVMAINPQAFSAPSAASASSALSTGLVFMLVGIIPMAFSWIYAAGNVWAARNITQRRHYIGCMIVSAINCMNVPFGTALGISSIMVLSRDSIKSKYEQVSSTPPKLLR